MEVDIRVRIKAMCRCCKKENNNLISIYIWLMENAIVSAQDEQILKRNEHSEE